MNDTTFDSLHLCEVCGDTPTHDRLCTSCAFQAMIDSVESKEYDEYCVVCGGVEAYSYTGIDGEHHVKCPHCGIIE